MKKIQKLLSFVLLLYVCLSLTGCCGHSGGGHSINPSNATVVGQVAVNSDGSVSFAGEGISFNAVPGTFSDGTTIKFTKVEGGDLLSYLGMSGKAITLDSDVYGIEITPQQEILSNAATITLDLTGNYDSNKKYYFSVNREFPTLVTTENPSRSLSVRASTQKSFDLGFVTMFKYIALANLNNETLASDPTLNCDSSSKEVSNDKYTSNVTVITQISTKDDIDKVFDGSVDFRLAVRTDGSNLLALSHKDTPLASRKSQSSSAINYGFIDLTRAQAVQIDKNTFEYNAFFDSINKAYQNVPRRIILESVFTGTDNIPVSSQEYVLNFRASKRPYVLSSYPAKDDTITNIAQLNDFVVNFSEPMNTASVENAVTVETQNHVYSSSNNDYKLTFEWADSNRKLNIKGNFALGTATGTFKVKIAQSASSASSNAKIAKNQFATTAEDVEWSFNYNKKDFYVVMTTPKPSANDIDVVNAENARKGPDITFTFSKPYISNLSENSVRLLTQSGESLKINISGKGAFANTFTITPISVLNYNSLYTVEIASDVEDFDKKEKLGETYRASFITKEPFASGSGTENDPYLVTNQTELGNIGLDGYVNTGKYYKLANDIDYQVNNNLQIGNNGSWNPIGSEEKPFNGHFDGNNKTIKNLVVNRTSDLCVGLFGKIVNANIKDLTIKSASVSGKATVGILAGYSVYSVISNIKISGLSIGGSDEDVGGLVGAANFTEISNCTIDSDKDLNFGTTDYCGGISGILLANSTVRNCRVTLGNNVQMVGSDYFGGLVGYSANSKITGSEFSGNLNSSGHEVGGIVGRASDKSSIESCHSLNGATSGKSCVGGICGNLLSNSSVVKCYTTTNLNGSTDKVGGLVGKAEDSDISNSYTTEITVTGKADSDGGIVGYLNNSNVEYCYSRAKVTGMDSVGGIAGKKGEGSVAITGCAALNPTLTGSNKDNVNKIIGQGSDAVLTKCYSIKSMKFEFNGAYGNNYSHEASTLDGKEGNTVSEIFSYIALDPTVWVTNANAEYPVLK